MDHSSVSIGFCELTATESSILAPSGNSIFAKMVDTSADHVSNRTPEPKLDVGKLIDPSLIKRSAQGKIER